MNKRCIYCQSISNVPESDIDCPQCGLQNKLTPFVSFPMMNASSMREFEAYESPATGEVITNHRARRRDMEASGCREWEGSDQERKHAVKCKAAEEKEFEDTIEKGVWEAFQQLPEEKKQLINNAV